MFIVVYPVFYYIVHYVCFQERSKMGLSCPHFILFPKGEVSSGSVSYADRWHLCMIVYDTCGDIKLSIFFASK